jgi:Uncharacterized conserved protein (DUF2203)
MKPRRERSKRMHALRLWTWDEVVKAIPYLRSITGSLREHWLDMLNAQRDIERGEKAKAPARTQQLLQNQKSLEERQRAQDKFEEALNELHGVEAFLLDPVRGTAAMPFRKEDDLAWYVFDHFAPRGVIGWRLQSDPDEECRPLQVLEDASAKDAPQK